MYRRILVPLEHSPSDDAILRHVRELASLCRSSLLLIHVADGWAARNLKPLQLRESEEMRADREYLEGCSAALRGGGIRCRIGAGRRRAGSGDCRRRRPGAV